MADIEEEIFSDIELKPYLWWRYIDDIFLGEHGEEKLKEFVEHLDEKHPQNILGYYSFTYSLLQVTTNLYVKHTDIAINISNLLHVTHITTRNKFHRARLFVLTESVQIVIHLTEDAMI